MLLFKGRATAIFIEEISTTLLFIAIGIESFYLMSETMYLVIMKKKYSTNLYLPYEASKHRTNPYPGLHLGLNYASPSEIIIDFTGQAFKLEMQTVKVI